MNPTKPGLVISGVACAVSRAVIGVAVIIVGHWRHKPETGEIVVIALGVESEADLPLLASLGFDGMTGPGVK